MSHSPAPWRLAKSYNNECVLDARGIMVADCCIAARGVTQEMVEANARLCAAAPKLLEALQAFSDHFGPLEDNHLLNDECRRCYALAREAFATVSGETSRLNASR